MTFLQIKGAQAMNQSVDLGGIMSMANQVISAVMSGVPKLVFLAWVLCIIALMGRLIGKQWLITKVGTTEIIGAAIAFGLVLK
jgi:hypothetical protein